MFLLLFQQKDENFVLKISENAERALVKSKWVEELDISKPIDNFDELLPDPAYKWEFELDTFQKQVNSCTLIKIVKNIFYKSGIPNIYI